MYSRASGVLWQVARGRCTMFPSRSSAFRADPESLSLPAPFFVLRTVIRETRCSVSCKRFANEQSGACSNLMLVVARIGAVTAYGRADSLLRHTLSQLWLERCACCLPCLTLRCLSHQVFNRRSWFIRISTRTDGNPCILDLPVHRCAGLPTVISGSRPISGISAHCRPR